MEKLPLHCPMSIPKVGQSQWLSLHPSDRRWLRQVSVVHEERVKMAKQQIDHIVQRRLQT